MKESKQERRILAARHAQIYENDGFWYIANYILSDGIILLPVAGTVAQIGIGLAYHDSKTLKNDCPIPSSGIYNQSNNSECECTC